MAKSRATYSKKEKEKKKLQKRKDKEEKKEARKASSSKGHNLEDMLAYVDENGNISSIPPDTSKKKKMILKPLLLEFTEIVPDIVKESTVTFFNESKIWIY